MVHSAALPRGPRRLALFRIRRISATDTIPADAPIAFLHPHRGWDASPLPASVDEYLAYRERSLAFVRARNARIGAATGKR